MNLSDLSKIDVKDLQKIDYRRLLDDLRKQPEILVVIAAVLGTIFFSLSVFSSTQKELADIQTDKRALEEKVKKIEAYAQAKAELTEFLNNIPPKITETQFVGLITDLANTHEIQINSLAPQSGEATAFYDTLRIDVSVTAKSYQDIWLFVRRIEHSAFAIRIDNWSGYLGAEEKTVSQRPATPPASEGEENKFIKSKISITAVNLKNS